MDCKKVLEGDRPVRDSYLVFGSPVIEEDEINEVVETMRSCWLGTGPRVQKFERMFKEYKGVKHAVAVNSCTAALHLALTAAGVGPGDEVITTPMTFCATANAIIHTGGIPVFADIDRDTMNIDPYEIEKKITERTKALLPVHFAGRPCDMDAIMNIARKHSLKVVEDCAHAIEAEYRGRKTGTFGDFGCFSFYATKNIATGEGGMIVTNNDNYANTVRTMSLHGISRDAWKRFSDEGYIHYQVIYPGFKYNMMDLQAAIGIHQLPRIERYSKRRKEIWDLYNNAFSDLPVVTPAPADENTVHAMHLYTLLVDSDKLEMTRDQVVEKLHRQNIGTGVHYTALHLHPYYKESYGYKRGDFPNAEYVSDRTFSLPISAKLTDRDVEDVIKALRKVMDK